jgi:hypothetical protein
VPDDARPLGYRDSAGVCRDRRKLFRRRLAVARPILPVFDRLHVSGRPTRRAHLKRQRSSRSACTVTA